MAAQFRRTEKKHIYMGKENIMPQPFSVGDKVTSDFFAGESDIVRTVIEVNAVGTSSTGWLIMADGGDPCPCCRRRPGKMIHGYTIQGVDSAWFKKVQ
jgi:hypothetical protein